MNSILIPALIGLLLLLAVYLITRRRREGTVILPPEDTDHQASTPDDDETMFDDYDAGIIDTLIVFGIDTVEIADPPPAVVQEVTPSFAIAHEPVARIEGGYQRMTADRGNYNSRGELVGTNWGIAAPVAEQYFGRVVTSEDMRNLSKDNAGEIFRRKFWDSMHAESLPTQELANIVYDGHVNHGGWGIRLLQRVVGVFEDGIVGPDTLAAVAERNPQQIYNDYFLARLSFYYAIVRNRPNQMVFWNGWMNRLEYYLSDYTGEPYQRPDPNRHVA